MWADMKKILVWLSLLLLPVISMAQSTTVSSSGVVDSDGVTWTNGSYTITFVPSPNWPSINSYTWSGGSLINNSVFTGSLNGSGAFSQSIPSSTAITPSGSKWKYTICPNAASGCFSINIASAGATQDVTSLLNSSAIGPRFPASPIAFGYSDVEVTPIPLPGGSYFNTATNGLREWNGTAWQNVGNGIFCPLTGCTINGNLAVNGSITATNPIGVSSGGTGSSAVPPAGTILTGQNTGLYYPVTPNGDCTYNQTGLLTCANFNHSISVTGNISNGAGAPPLLASSVAPTGHQAMSPADLGGNTLSATLTKLNGIQFASNFTGSAANKINSCISASIVNGSNYCIVDIYGSGIPLNSDIFSGIIAPPTPLYVQFLAGESFTVTSTQNIPSNTQIIGITSLNGVGFTWTGTSGGIVFNASMATASTVQGIAVNCANIAAIGIELAGGPTNTFNTILDHVIVENCTNSGLENTLTTSFPVTMTNTGGTLTITPTSISFPAYWIGLPSKNFVITGSTDSTFNTPLSSISLNSTVISSNSITASVPQTTWNPSIASGVTGTITFNSQAQDHYCLSCYIQFNNIGISEAAGLSRYSKGNINSNNIGVKLFGVLTTGTFGAFVSVDGVTYSANGTDIYFAGNNTLYTDSQTWHERSTTGVIGSDPNITGINLTISGSPNIDSLGSTGWASLNNGQTGSLNFISDHFYFGASNATANLNPGIRVYYTPWTNVGLAQVPSFTGQSINRGVATLSSGQVTINTSYACTPSNTCVYSFSHCSNTAGSIGTLILSSVTGGTSFGIASIGAGGGVVTGDNYSVCWSIAN